MSGAERSEGANCLTCRHNGYIGLATDWFDCVHPKTLERGPRWQIGDPAMVNYRTADVHVSRIADLGECAAYEAQEPSP